jgi:hypothetical protein
MDTLPARNSLNISRDGILFGTIKHTFYVRCSISSRRAVLEVSK